MPGCWLEIGESGEQRSEQYWDVPTSAPDNGRSENYYVDAYRARLESAVSSHLMSDVPLGVFLSGGLDSSAVAALMTQIRRAPIETFSVGYREQSHSELPHARVVARHLKSVHHEVLVSEAEFFDALPQLIWHEDEPIAWPSSVALYFLARHGARTRHGRPHRRGQRRDSGGLFALCVHFEKCRGPPRLRTSGP